MNKKLFLGMFAAAGMLLATSCQNDELDAVQAGNEATVSFTLGVEGAAQTRAISDGKTADLLYYAIFDANKKLITTIADSDNGLLKKENAFPDQSKQDVVEVTLAKGQEYTAVFWAQNSACEKYYSVTAEEDGLKVAVDYEGENNDESRDAFFKAETFTVTGNTDIDVLLKRPFAQINVGVTEADWKAAVNSGIDITESKVIIKNAATSINLLDGSVSGEQVVEYGFAAIPAKFTTAETLEVDINRDGSIQDDEKYKYLSMSYILTDNDADRTTLEADGLQFAFSPAAGEDIVFDEGLHAVPVQRNWRTNILGKILTGDIKFSIEIDQRFDDNYNFLYPDDDDASDVENVTNITELQTALNNAKNGTVIYFANDITGNVTATQKPDVKISILGNGYKFNGMLTVDGQSATYSTAGLTIKDVNFAAESVSGDAVIRLGDGTNATRYTCNVTVENCTFDVSGAVGVKSYTAGDENLIIKGCTATDKTHSLVQADNIHKSILVEKCCIYSKNGMNFNNSPKVIIKDCTVDVNGYAVRFGAKTGGDGTAEVYSIENSTLKSANDEGDAVIILRSTADHATLTIENTTIDGTPEISNAAKDAVIIVDGVATVNSTNGLAKVVAAGYTTINLTESDYTLPEAKGKTLTFVGIGDVSKIEINANIDQNMSGSNVTFNNVTLKLDNTSNYEGLKHIAKAEYRNCSFVGKHFLYAESKFVDCTFSNNEDYCIWTYGANKTEFTNCNFMTGGKAVLIYAETAISAEHIFSKCRFEDDDNLSTKKAAIEIGESAGGAKAYYTVKIEQCTVSGFAVNDEGYNTGSELWGNKNNMPEEQLNIIIDGKDVY